MNKFVLPLFLGLCAIPSCALDQVAFAASADTLTLGAWLARDSAIGKPGNHDPQGEKLRALHRDLVSALVAAQAADDAERAKGRAPSSCRPTTGSSQLTAEDIAKWLRARPKAEHSSPLSNVLRRFLNESLSCK